MDRFKEEKLLPSQFDAFTKELNGLCEPRNNKLMSDHERFGCYHALGHLLMYATDADTNHSVDLCTRLTRFTNNPMMTSSCNDGVFMQIFQPLEPEDFALIKGKVPEKGSLFQYCGAFSQEAQTSCWSEGWPLYFKRIEDPKETVAYCLRLPREEQRAWCVSGMFSRMVTHFNLDETRIGHYCDQVPANLKGKCYGISASRMLDIDKRLLDRANRFCGGIKEESMRKECFINIESTVRFISSPQ